MTMATTTSTRPTRQQFFATETMDSHGYSAPGGSSHKRTVFYNGKEAVAVVSLTRCKPPKRNK